MESAHDGADQTDILDDLGTTYEKYPSGTKICQPTPKVENGKQTQVIAFGKQVPRAMPTTAAAIPHSRTALNETGNAPRATRPKPPIQKQPSPPTNAPRIRSRLVTGARHQAAKRRTMLLIMGIDLKRVFNTGPPQFTIPRELGMPHAYQMNDPRLSSGSSSILSHFGPGS